MIFPAPTQEARFQGRSQFINDEPSSSPDDEDTDTDSNPVLPSSAEDKIHPLPPSGDDNEYLALQKSLDNTITSNREYL
jgi:hypothetical protein